MAYEKLVVDKEQLITWRRWLHQHPETFGQEAETSAYLKQELKALGYEIVEGIFEHGFAAVLPGDPNKKCVAMRADMDALPILEQTGFEFASLNPGKMHACGHDAHMTIALGVAQAMAEAKPEGSVKFIFQPREEKPPGGAKFMVENGVLKNPDVDMIFGCHVNANFATGEVGLRNGTIMAVADDFTLTIKGRGGHGSAPQATHDPIFVTAEVIVAIQSIVSRMNNPMEPLVISLGTIHGGTSQNIIPDEVVLTGTLRCLNNETRDLALERLRHLLDGISNAWDVEYDLDFLYGYPPLNSAPEVVDRLREVVAEMDGLQVVEMPHSLLAGEDFAYYAQEVPAAYFMLGCREEGRHFPWHHACFTVNEDCLPLGVDLIANAMLKAASEDK